MEQRRAEDKQVQDYIQRLTSIENKMDYICEKMEQNDVKSTETLKTLSANMQKINQLIIGDGDKAGLVEKVRGIEGIFNHIKLLWVAVAASVVDFVFRTFFHNRTGG